MGDTNYIGSIVKILENPSKILFKNNIPIIQFRVQLPQVKNNRIINLTLLGNLARDVAKYYKINDYIIIEGYLSIRNKRVNNSKIQNSKRVEITVLKVYPFLLNSSNNNGQ